MSKGFFSPSVDEWIRRWGAPILLLFAFFYYGYYYNCGIYPCAEGGVEGVNALRLMAGQRPIVDTFFGYNVLWFYPAVWIFKIVGPSYTALRIFFLLLCTATGLIVFHLGLRCLRNAGLALLGGVLVILVPGQMFRNYMAFLAVLNLFVFLPAYVLPSRSVARRLAWMLGAGVSLGITFLIRIDLGYFFLFILSGLILAFPLAHSVTEGRLRRVLLAMMGALLGAAGVIAVHTPVVTDAQRRGFGPEFAAQYGQWPAMIHGQAKRLGDAACSYVSGVKESLHTALSPRNSKVSAVAPRADVPTVVPDAAASPSPSPGVAGVTNVPDASATKITSASLQRAPLTAPKARDRMLAINLYLPIPLAIVIAVVGLIFWLSSLISRDEEQRIPSLTLLLSLGCSLTLFPQYFFWRPDMVHLSEFMVPMSLTLLLAISFFLRFFRGDPMRRALGIALALICLTTLVLYYINACQSQASGGIAVSQHKTADFRACNGVHVRMTPREFEHYSALHSTIMAVSRPGEFVVCYPYNPEINFMTDRPSYEHNLYADNDLRGDVFSRDAIAKIEQFQPAAVVISDWDINSTEESRFYNWAWEAYGYLTRNYVLACKTGNFEVYVRPDRAERIPKP